jgi:hypothetical protein
MPAFEVSHAETARADRRGAFRARTHHPVRTAATGHGSTSHAPLHHPSSTQQSSTASRLPRLSPPPPYTCPKPHAPPLNERRLREGNWDPELWPRQVRARERSRTAAHAHQFPHALATPLQSTSPAPATSPTTELGRLNLESKLKMFVKIGSKVPFV